MAASLISLVVVGLQSGFSSTAFALAAFSSFASGVVNASLSKRGRDVKPVVPVSVRQPTAPHQIIYGTKRVGGTVVFLGTSDRTENVSGDIRILEDHHLHLVIAIAGHEINAVKKVYFGDELIYDNGTYQTWRGSRTWDEFATLYIYDGTQTTADTTLINGDSYVLEGRTFTQVPVGTVVDAGDFVVGETYEIKTVGTTDFTAIGAASNTVGVEFTATGAGSGTGTAYESKTRWTSDHKLQGIAYVHIRLRNSTKVFPAGAPQVSFVVEGKKVYDPDTATTAFSNNPALCIRDYLTDTRHGLGEASANIDDTSFINIKDICDEDVTLDAGGTQKRYTLDGVLDSSVSIKENLAKMLTSFNGELSYSGGKFFLTGGEYVTPTVTITEDEIVGPLQIATKSSRRDTYNGVKGVFSSEENNYIETDYPTATSSIYEAKDGEQILLDVSLPFTTNNIRAQRIAKQIMLQSRQQVVVTIPMNLVGMKFKAGDTFYLTNTRLGYTNKPFKVQGWELAFGGTDGNIVVNVTAREAGAVLHPETADTYLTDVYQWQTSDEQEFVVTGKVPVPDASTVSAPTDLTATQVTVIASDGSVTSDLDITWTESENSFVDRYELQYRRTNSVTASDGTTVAAEDDPTSVFVFGTRYVLSGINEGEQYEIKLRALTPLGVQSDFDTTTITASGDVTAPTAPTVVTPSPDHERVRLEVTAPSERDVMGIEVFNTTSSGATPTTPSFFIPASPGETVFYNHEKLTNGTAQYYFFRSIDYSDNASAWSIQYSATPSERYAEGATVGAQVGVDLNDYSGALIGNDDEIKNNQVINVPSAGGDGKVKSNAVVTDSITDNAVSETITQTFLTSNDIFIFGHPAGEDMESPNGRGYSIRTKGQTPAAYSRDQIVSQVYLGSVPLGETLAADTDYQLTATLSFKLLVNPTMVINEVEKPYLSCVETAAEAVFRFVNNSQVDQSPATSTTEVSDDLYWDWVDDYSNKYQLSNTGYSLTGHYTEARVALNMSPVEMESMQSSIIKTKVATRTAVSYSVSGSGLTHTQTYSVDNTSFPASQKSSYSTTAIDLEPTRGINVDLSSKINPLTLSMIPDEGFCVIKLNRDFSFSVTGSTSGLLDGTHTLNNPYWVCSFTKVASEDNTIEIIPLHAKNFKSSSFYPPIIFRNLPVLMNGNPKKALNTIIAEFVLRGVSTSSLPSGLLEIHEDDDFYIIRKDLKVNAPEVPEYYAFDEVSGMQSYGYDDQGPLVIQDTVTVKAGESAIGVVVDLASRGGLLTDWSSTSSNNWWYYGTHLNSAGSYDNHKHFDTTAANADTEVAKLPEWNFGGVQHGPHGLIVREVKVELLRLKK